MTGEHELVPTLPFWTRLRANIGRRARKAWAGGVAGATAVLATISFVGFFADGKVDGGKVFTAVGAVVTGFVGGFLPVFFASNAPHPATPTPQPAQYAPSATDYRAEQGDPPAAS